MTHYDVSNEPRHPVMNCTCSEGRIVKEDGSVVFMPPVHDCAYIKKRESFIPRAEIIASSVIREMYPKFLRHPSYHPEWGRYVIAEVDRLMEENP